MPIHEERAAWKRVAPVCWIAAALLMLQAAALAGRARRAGGDRPRLAVLPFKGPAENRWWWHGGAQSMQDVFVTELVKGGKFRVVEREQLEALMKEKNLTLSGDVDPATAKRAGPALGVRYLLTGAVTEYGVKGPAAGSGTGAPRGQGRFVAVVKGRLIDTSTGEVVWADEARNQVSVGGFGGGVDDERMFDKVMKPCIRRLTARLKAASLVPKPRAAVRR
jgi:curli biogenesis system outer membrane secretion channel CsgG